MLELFVNADSRALFVPPKPLLDALFDLVLGDAVLVSYHAYLSAGEHPRVIIDAAEDAMDYVRREVAQERSPILIVLLRIADAGRRALAPGNALRVACERAIARGSRHFTVSLDEHEKATLSEHDVPYDVEISENGPLYLIHQSAWPGSFLRAVSNGGPRSMTYWSQKDGEAGFRTALGDLLKKVDVEYSPGCRWSGRLLGDVPVFARPIGYTGDLLAPLKTSVVPIGPDGEPVLAGGAP